MPRAAFSQGNQLTKEEIVQIATGEARQLGYKTEEMNMVYDDDNRNLKEYFATPEKYHPELKDKDYQAIYLYFKENVMGTGLWVFVDKTTGEILGYDTDFWAEDDPVLTD
jgi:hypothetical protein